LEKLENWKIWKIGKIGKKLRWPGGCPTGPPSSICTMLDFLFKLPDQIFYSITSYNKQFVFVFARGYNVLALFSVFRFSSNNPKMAGD
jgi:hypothetical protein